MTQTAALILLACAFIAGAVTIYRVTAWSFSTTRRHRIEAKAYAKAARHRAGRWAA